MLQNKNDQQITVDILLTWRMTFVVRRLKNDLRHVSHDMLLQYISRTALYHRHYTYCLWLYWVWSFSDSVIEELEELTLSIRRNAMTSKAWQAVMALLELRDYMLKVDHWYTPRTHATDVHHWWTSLCDARHRRQPSSLIFACIVYERALTPSIVLFAKSCRSLLKFIPPQARCMLSCEIFFARDLF